MLSHYESSLLLVVYWNLLNQIFISYVKSLPPVFRLSFDRNGFLFSPVTVSIKEEDIEIVFVVKFTILICNLVFCTFTSDGARPRVIQCLMVPCPAIEVQLLMCCVVDSFGTTKYYICIRFSVFD